MEKQQINYKKIYDGISDKNLRFNFVKNYVIDNKYFDIQNAYLLIEDRFQNWNDELDNELINHPNLKIPFTYYITKNKQILSEKFLNKCTNEKLYNLFLVCIYFEHLSLFDKILELDKIPDIILYFGLLVNEKNNKEIIKKIITKIINKNNFNENLLENFIENEKIYLNFFEFAPNLLQKIKNLGNYTRKNLTINFLSQIKKYEEYIECGDCEELVFHEFEKLASKYIEEKEQKIEELNNVLSEKNEQICNIELIYENYYLDKIKEIEQKNKKKMKELKNIIITKDDDLEFFYKKNNNLENIIDENNKKYEIEINNIRKIFNDIIAEKDAISTELLNNLKKTLKILGEKEQELEKLQNKMTVFNIEDYIEKDNRNKEKIGFLQDVIEKILKIV